MLDIKGVKKSYGEFQLDCSLNVEKGRITGLVGENGAGKSTVFKAVLGLISYDGGEIKILGKTPQELSEKEKEQIGVVLAEAGFSGYLKGKDVKAVLAKLYPKFEEEKFLQMCERYQIPLDKFLKEYSTGMKAKLNLIIALTHQADFLMLDEPTAGLDVGAREGMLDILRTYMEEEPERSILISSHISSDLEHLCDDIYVIHKGKIVLHEEMDRILEKYAMLKVSEEQYDERNQRTFGKGFSVVSLSRWKIFSCNCNCGVIFKSFRKYGDQFCLYLYYKCNGNLFWKYN